jgi:hypothetical protein
MVGVPARNHLCLKERSHDFMNVIFSVHGFREDAASEPFINDSPRKTTTRDRHEHALGDWRHCRENLENVPYIAVKAAAYFLG